MAQAVFDEHPIEQYLRDYGEVPELMPGGAIEFFRKQPHDPYYDPILRQWLQGIIRPLCNTAFHVLEATGLRRHSPASEFAERFKYIVISSSLLTSSFTPTPPNRAVTPTTPGHYEHRTSPLEAKAAVTTDTPVGSSMPLLAFSLACLIPAALLQSHYISIILIIITTTVFSGHGPSLSTSFTQCEEGESWSSTTLGALDGLVSANDAWNGVLSEALAILEDEERHESFSSPSSPLRIAFSSSLHTTQTQCDNVRQLLSALTSPVLLSQLLEMYAPPSPSPVHTFASSSSLSRRTSFAPTLHRSRSFTPTRSTPELADSEDPHTHTSSSALNFPSDKRSTWNGSYMSLTGFPQRRQKHRPDLGAVVFQDGLKSPTNQNAKGSSSVPPTPSYLLGDQHLTVEGGDADTEEEPFGTLALDLHRKRRGTRASFERLRLPSGSSVTSTSPGVHKFPLSSLIGSNFTTLNPATSSSRHTLLSLPNLRLALHAALGAKRFACSHLLGLRFADPQRPAPADEDDEDESYWEDVRSVISLLTSTFEDTSARLGEALASATPQDTREDPATPVSQPAQTPLSAYGTQFFAPIPSHMSRFAAHANAISTTLSDASEHLRATVTSLHELGQDATDTSAASESPLEHYERLRRELGFALRECERGRGILMELVARRPASGLDGEEDDLPARNDEHLSSGESDKTLFSLDDQPDVKGAHFLEEEPGTHEYVAANDYDDASAHLIMTTTSQHLPRPGIEQVFESLSATSHQFARERSKLTREERIRLAKERRENASASMVEGVELGKQLPQIREGWGPGGDVVQELKNVIWKVGEQRRRMVGRPSSSSSNAILP